MLASRWNWLRPNINGVRPVGDANLEIDNTAWESMAPHVIRTAGMSGNPSFMRSGPVQIWGDGRKLTLACGSPMRAGMLFQMAVPLRHRYSSWTG
jgi:hypothetical protein